MENVTTENNFKDAAKPTCLNCKHFCQHYIKCGVNFHPSKCGHCTNRYLMGKTNLNIPYKENCKHWVKDEIPVYKKYEDTTTAFNEISSRLNEIAFIIKEKI